jgi:fatty acid desaturase
MYARGLEITWPPWWASKRCPLTSSVLTCSTYIDTLAVAAPVTWALWMAYWFFQGAVCTGLWVIAHECGHQAFSKYQAVNDAVGLVVHSCLLVPYYSWYA